MPLRLLRQHPVRHIEVFSGISDELRVAWMIDSFHADDDVHQRIRVSDQTLSQEELKKVAARMAQDRAVEMIAVPQ